MERDEEMKKLWAKVGEDVRLVVVDDDDVEQEEEDREVERILVKGKEAKRKLATGMYGFNVELVKLHCTVHITIIYTMSNMSNSVPYLLAVRTVAAGHRMIVEGWEMFKEAVEAAGTGDLPQLLRSLRGMTMPTPPPPPPPTPPPAGPIEQQGATAVAMEVAGVSGVSPVKKEGASSEPVVVVVGGDKKMGLSTVFNCRGVEEWLQHPYQAGPYRKGSSLWPV